MPQLPAECQSTNSITCSSPQVPSRRETGWNNLKNHLHHRQPAGYDEKVRKIISHLLKKPIWLIIAFALILRLPLLTGSFWLDEAAQAIESSRPLAEQLDIVADFQPPLLHYLIHFATYFSYQEWWLRMWGALIPGIITIWASYQIGKKLFSEKVGLWTALLLATSSFHIFYSQELRPYSLPAMWGSLSTLALITKPFNNWKFILFSLAGLYSSYLYPFLLITQIIVLWLRQRSIAKLLQTTLLITIGYLPWLPMFFQQLKAGQSLRLEIPGWETVVSIPQFKALLLVPLKFIFGVLNLELTWPFLFAIFIFGFLCIKLFWQNPKHLWINLLNNFGNLPKLWRKLDSRNQMALLLFLPLITAWLISFVVPVIQPKRVLFALPFFYLIFTSLLAWKKIDKESNKNLHFLLYFFLFINLWSTVSYWHETTLQRENWRELKQTIVERFPASSTLVIMSFDGAFAPWRWYEPEYPTLVTGRRHVQDVISLKETLKPTFDKEYVLVFDYLRTLTDPQDKILETLTDFGFTGRGVIDYPGIGFVRIYARTHSAISTLKR